MENNIIQIVDEYLFEVLYILKNKYNICTNGINNTLRRTHIRKWMIDNYPDSLNDSIEKTAEQLNYYYHSFIVLDA